MVLIVSNLLKPSVTAPVKLSVRLGLHAADLMDMTGILQEQMVSRRNNPITTQVSRESKLQKQKNIP